MKIVLTLLLLVSFVMAKSYHFSEERYSDALGKSIELQGIISFGDARLEILYDEDASKLLYEDEELTMYKGEEEIEIDENEAMKIAQYFEIILLLYENDVQKLKENFYVKKEQKKTLLLPKDAMQNYIQKIELIHKKEALKSLELFLSNDDTIKISIENEVH